LSTSVLRIFSPYGTGQEKRLVPDLVFRVREGRSVTANREGGPWLSPIAIQDLVTGFLALLEADGHQVVNAAGDEALALEEMARIIGSVLKRGPVIELQDKTGPGMVCGNNQRFKQLAGITRVMSFREGLESYLQPIAV
jgi:nucleoside-diphosphate-sugar epimerase